MYETEAKNTGDFSSFSKFEDSDPSKGMHDWAVPWSDLMMVMFVLFVVLYVYSQSHQDVRVLFSQQSADSAQSTSTLDPLIGLIGQIASRADIQGNKDVVRMADNQVLYRSREDGVSVIREGQNRVRVTLRGHLFFDAGNGKLKPEATNYLAEIAQVIKLSVGAVNVIGFASEDEIDSTGSFELSTNRAADVARFLITQFNIDPKRVIIAGRGAFSPEVPATSEANQVKNRRVEILITNEI